MIKINISTADSASRSTQELLTAVAQRQQNDPEANIENVVLHHLAGAMAALLINKDLALLPETLSTHFNTTTQAHYLVEDTAIHIVTTLEKSLIRTLEQNLTDGFSPLIITYGTTAAALREIAVNLAIIDRIDIFEMNQFLTIGILKLSNFDGTNRLPALEKLIKAYNQIIDMCETDPSLKISLG